MNPTTNPTTPPEPQAGATSRKKIKRYSMLTMMGISVMRPEPDGEYVTYQNHIAALATSRAETEAARAERDAAEKKLNERTSQWMQQRENIIIYQKRNGELCEELVPLRAQLATLTATLAQREAEADTLRILAEERRKEIAAYGSHGWIEIQKTCGRHVERIKKLEGKIEQAVEGLINGAAGYEPTTECNKAVKLLTDATR